MLWFPVKKIRKQFKLLLLLVLLTCAVWFTYLHISLVRQGRALRLHFAYGRDGERLGEVTDAGRRAAGALASPQQRKAEDSNESREEEQMNEGQDGDSWFSRGQGPGQAGRAPVLNMTKHVLPWNDQYKGKANLHVFEDWCGGAVRQLRKNLHFPLFPHSRMTVKKLAVSPKWKNYGLRVFGYIHPFKDGDFQFSVASDDNSEFWLSSDESPSNTRLVAFVGRLGTEWTAPGEFTKFSSQVSKPIRLMSSRRYYFELLHKQDDRGSDHVEVGWRVFLPSLKFEVIDSPYISLYTDESTLKMNQVDHIPQSYASHTGSYLWETQRDEHGADMLRSDPRDTFFLTPQIEASRVENVLVPCAYSPTYVVKDFPIARYQGLQFVYLSFVYPNDFTRLTHMETENKCFYRESPLYLEKFGFYKYMKMDEEEEDPHQRAFLFLNSDNFLEEEEEGADSPEPTDPPPDAKKRSPAVPNSRLSTGFKRKEIPLAARDYGDDVDYYTFRHKPGRVNDVGPPPGQPITWDVHDGTSPSSLAMARGFHDNENTALAQEQTVVHGRSLSWMPKEPDEGDEDGLGLLSPSKRGSSLNFQPHLSIPIFSSKAKAPKEEKKPKEEKQPKKESKKPQEKVYVTRLQPKKRKALVQEAAFPGVFIYPKPLRKVHLHSKAPQRRPAPSSKLHTIPSHRAPWLMDHLSRETELSKRKSPKARGRKWEQLYKREDPGARGKQRVRPSILTPKAEGLFSKEALEVTTASPARAAGVAAMDYNSSEVALLEGTRVTSFLRMSEMTESQQEDGEHLGKGPEEGEEEELSDYSYENAELQQSWLEDAINWQRTFSVSSVDFELLRSDWNDLRCNVSGNLQLSESEVVDVVAQYMEKLNEKNGGIYTLLRIVNMEKRRDTARGNRYLMELELMERGQRTVRLSEYVYVLLHQGKQDDSTEANPDGLAPMATESQPQPSTWNLLYGKPILCQPLRLSWRQDVMVHFVVPVKNQARWVQQFISDMANLYWNTKDANFNIILVDFDSDDMDVEKALQEARLPRYQYLKRTGNFERSAGLQAGVDTIEDGRSIVFLCDLHIHFPLNILDSIRKHCVEGKLAYAPIVMRLSCGSSPQEPNGYWEVNGFGLFGIYKSDFDRVGGMNTEEFRDRWGGEDWELLDRVLQSGLEVERLRLRNFYHYYHSKRGMWNSRSKKTPKD
ncbi:N-acetyl-beta-glucosaminyl-glycoprotein 4-beta-N-acetylgalactosaminyltransferase 1 isoform X1 [Alligator mississippiensis]|uniref:N-acetyl-beta-glucosaminyl-glycoprotein 4-beta-N-acetylgalactosaminyltransferase 1 isoform X1 n=1 Tax=Alligator mississippiensis TaxID=8496 RepID=UPI0006ECBDC3|nr:N-acetyl-beta-glucosaminyl-glycoprotein 4-beta-N-acetylgalactosaminyltransferase 1 isoform X1 [Alligator mississippiensis]